MRAWTAVLASLLLAGTAGCAEGLRFRADDRLRFLAPADRSFVEGPLDVRWTLGGHDLRADRTAGSRTARGAIFAVFVDRAPMRPGETVEAIADEDIYCRREVRCPDRRWLQRHGIHLTRRPWVRLAPLRRHEGLDLGDRRRHEVTVVLLDARGVRIDEAAWSLTVYTAQEDA